jgi:hypothetical protein
MEKPSPEDDQHEQHTRQADDTKPKGLDVEQALKLFGEAKKYVDSGYRTHWDNYFKVYKGRRVSRNYEGVADISIRESHTIIETLVANIASGYPKFSFVTTNEEQSRDTEVLNEMMDYYMLCNQMGLKNQEWVREMLLYGTGILGVEWRDGEPFIFNIPLRDFFFDPTATGMVQTLNPAKWAGYEYLADKTELENAEIFDAKQNKWVKRYKNLDKIGKPAKAKGGKGSMDKAFKDMFNKSTLGETASENQVHVIKLHHIPTGRIYEIGNQKEFIYDEPTWCQRDEETRMVKVTVEEEEIEVPQQLDEIKPFLPFAILRDYIDSSQFLGAGEMELLLPDAELLNDYESMQVDNNAYQNTPMYWVDPQFADLIPEIETIPGAVYPIPRNAMGTIERPQLSTDIDNKEDRIMQRMRRSTAADEAVQGGATGNSRTTATEVSTQLQQAQMRFSTKISNLESEGYAQLALLIFKMVQIFVTKKTAIRIVGQEGVYFKDFDPWEYNGKWEAHAQLDTTIKQAQMEVGLKDQAVYDSLIKTPGLDPIAIARWWAKKKDPNMTDEEFNKFILPPQPPQEDVKDMVVMQYKDLEPWGRYQAQIKAGFDPDPSLAGDQQVRMLEQANKGADLADPATNVDNTPVLGLEDQATPPAPTPAEINPELQPA